jgi:cytochrome P450
VETFSSAQLTDRLTSFHLGPVVRIGPNEVDITDLEAVKVIYSIKTPFQKSQFYRRLATTGQQSLFTTVNADFHRRHRRLLAGPMAESSLKLMIPNVDRLVKLAVQRIGEEISSNEAADLCKWFHFMTTDIIGELTFGSSFNMLDLRHVRW